MPRESNLTATRPELLGGRTDAAFRDLVHDALAFSSRLHDIRNRLASVLGLSGSQYTILIAIRSFRADMDIGVNAIAERLHLSGAFVTIEINKLVAAGLVEKHPDPSDGRRVRLVATPKAEQQLQELTAVQALVNDALFSNLAAEEFDILCRMVKRLVAHADEALALLDFHTMKTGTDGRR